MRPAPLFGLISTLAATGCTTISPQEQRQRDEEQCRAHGFHQKNDAFAECRQRLDLDRRAGRRSVAMGDPWLRDRWMQGGPRVVIVRPPLR